MGLYSDGVTIDSPLVATAGAGIVALSPCSAAFGGRRR